MSCRRTPRSIETPLPPSRSFGLTFNGLLACCPVDAVALFGGDFNARLTPRASGAIGHIASATLDGH
eukprot:10229850-Alexandrium_andersonii.AAC.1